MAKMLMAKMFDSEEVVNVAVDTSFTDETRDVLDTMPEFAHEAEPADFYEFHRNKFAKRAHLHVLHAPCFQESHTALRTALRNILSSNNLLDDMSMCEATGQAPSKEVRMQLGEAGIFAMMQGPGEHLKYAPNGLLHGVVKPQEFDYFHALIVCEERMRFFCPRWEDGLDACVSGVPVIISHGSDLIKEFILPDIFKGAKTCTLAIHEASASSSDVTRAVSWHPKTKNYIINGTKKCGALCADWLVTAVCPDGESVAGMSMILIPKSDHVRTTIIKPTHLSSAGTSSVRYDNAVVPQKNVLSQGEGGYKILMSHFNHDRWVMSVSGVFRARMCTEEVCKWALHRKTFGNKLVGQPLVQDILSQMFSRVEQASSKCYETTQVMNRFGLQSTEVGCRIAILKHSVARMCHFVAASATQILRERNASSGPFQSRVVETFHDLYKSPFAFAGIEATTAEFAVQRAMTHPWPAKL